MDSIQVLSKKIWQYREGLFGIVLILIVTGLLIVKNWPIFGLPNFYAEDATIIFNNVYTNPNPFDSTITLFNGYTISGLYVLAYVSAGVNLIFGNDIVDLPLVTSVVSCLFFAFVICLPWFLFRKELGRVFCVCLILVSSYVPIRGSDYAIFGTLGNLKFLFLYLAFILLLYRILHPFARIRKMLVIDSMLLFCVMTNVTVTFLLPFALWPYRSEFKKFIKSKNLRVFSFQLRSLVALGSVSFIYIFVALVHGIPKLPGYLDGPLERAAIFPIIDRTFTYSWFYPITNTFNNWIVILLLVVFGIWGYVISKDKDRIVYLFGIVAACLGTGLFVLNRPGVGEYYLNYGHNGGPDQFFYAQNLIVIFITFWAIRILLNKMSTNKKILLTSIFAVYLIWAIPFSSSYGKSQVVYKGIGTVSKNLEKACNSPGDVVILQVYPTAYWQWYIDKKLACNN